MASIDRKDMVLMVLAHAGGKPVSRGRLLATVLLVQSALLEKGVDILPEPYPVGEEDVEEIAGLLEREREAVA